MKKGTKKFTKEEGMKKTLSPSTDNFKKTQYQMRNKS